MTEVITGPDLRTVADSELAAMWAQADEDGQAALEAECTRRDRAERRERAERALRYEWYDAMHAQREAFEAEGIGYVLNREGKRRGISEWAIWTGSASLLEQYGSDEIKAFFGKKNNARLTFAEFKRQRARAGRIQREEWRDREQITERGTEDDHGHEHEQAVMAGHEAGALRRDETAPPAPQGGPGRAVDGGGPDDGRAEDHREAAGAGGGRPGGSVRGDAVTVTEAPAPFIDEADTGRPADAAGYMAKAAGCKHYRTRYGTPAQCGDCPAARLGPVRAPSEVAVPETAAVARTAQPIDGARLLNIADAWKSKHVWMSDAARHAAVLYVAAQHFRLAESGRLAWPRFGRMLYVADEPGSGKTTAMVLMGYMSGPWFQGIDSNPTAPGLCLTIAHEKACLYIDEMHRLLGSKGTKKADVVTILNVGYEKNGTYLNGRGGKPNRVPVYAPAVMAGKDDLIKSAAEEIGDLIDRCAAVVHMRKPPADVQLAELTDATEAQGAAIAQRLAAWAAEQMADEDRFRQAFTVACDRAREIGLTGRPKDVWVPLIATGWLASEGHADAACEAALEFRRNRPVQHEDEPDPLAGLEAELAGDGELGW